MMILISVLSLVLTLVFKPNILTMFGFLELDKNQDLDVNVNSIDTTRAQEIADWLRVGFIHHTLDRQVSELDSVINKSDMQKVLIQFGSISYYNGEYDLAYNTGATFNLYDAFRYYFEWNYDKISEKTKQKIKDKLLLDGYIL